MKIDIDKNVVNLVPENELETNEVEKLWKMLVGCVTNSKKLAPIGEYIPSKKNVASFYIEDETEKGTKELEIDENLVLEDGKYYCGICNKLIDLHTGDEIPVCCGIRMEEVD